MPKKPPKKLKENLYLQKVNLAVDEFVESNTYWFGDNIADGHTVDELSVFALNSCFDMVSRGGKRIRAELFRLGEQIGGGRLAQEQTIKAAVAIEGIHAFLLIKDDMADDAYTRRGGPSIHRMVEDFIKEKYPERPNPDVLARKLTDVAAQVLYEQSLLVLANIDAPTSLVLLAKDLLARHIKTTGLGQLADISLSGTVEVKRSQIEEVIKAKTAYYSFYMPLQVGMILGGSNLKDTENFIGWAEYMGYAFQVLDDAKPYLGKEDGKDKLSDMREGKMTLIVHTALEICRGTEDYKVLMGLLGKKDLSEEDFQTAVKMVESTGALKDELGSAKKKLKQAKDILEELPKLSELSEEGLGFLKELTAKLQRDVEMALAYTVK